MSLFKCTYEIYMCVCVFVFVCIHTESQNGYYNLINIKYIKELIIYGYTCVKKVLSLSLSLSGFKENPTIKLHAHLCP